MKSLLMSILLIVCSTSVISQQSSTVWKAQYSPETKSITFTAPNGQALKTGNWLQEKKDKACASEKTINNTAWCLTPLGFTTTYESKAWKVTMLIERRPSEQVLITLAKSEYMIIFPPAGEIEQLDRTQSTRSYPIELKITALK